MSTENITDNIHPSVITEELRGRYLYAQGLPYKKVQNRDFGDGFSAGCT